MGGRKTKSMRSVEGEKSKEKGGGEKEGRMEEERNGRKNKEKGEGEKEKEIHLMS